jgi:hypothetical protein
MCWTTVRGHRPVGPVIYERPLGDQDVQLEDVGQACSLRRALLCGAHRSARGRLTWRLAVAQRQPQP